MVRRLRTAFIGAAVIEVDGMECTNVPRRRRLDAFLRAARSAFGTELEGWRFRLNGSLGRPQCDNGISAKACFDSPKTCCCIPPSKDFGGQNLPFAHYYGLLVDDPWSSWVRGVGDTAAPGGCFFRAAVDPACGGGDPTRAIFYIGVVCYFSFLIAAALVLKRCLPPAGGEEAAPPRLRHGSRSRHRSVRGDAHSAATGAGGTQ